MKAHLRRISLFMWGIMMVSGLAFSAMADGHEGLMAAAEVLSQSPKLLQPVDILRDFRDGRPTTRVIVNLLPPLVSNGDSHFSNHASREGLREAVAATQDRVIRQMDPWDVRITNRFTYIFGFSAEVTSDGLDDLLKAPGVISVEEDRIVYAQLAQGIPLMNAAIPRLSHNGAGIAIAICDTGIDYTHPALGGDECPPPPPSGGGSCFPNTKVIGGWDVGDDDEDPMDQDGHGTACAGIAAGNLGTVGDYIGGVAHGARLYAVKISKDTGDTGSASTSDMIEGWEWCITHQHDDPNNPIMVVSTSFGGGRYTSACDSDTPAMTAAAANAVAAGMTVFVSSGNDGYCDSMGWPACISHVVSVGAVYDAHFTSSAIGWCVSRFSCAPKYTGGCTTGYYSPEVPYADQVIVYSNTASFLSLLAPSNWATTSQRGGGYWNTAYGFGGTSAACPYAAGAAACLQSAAMALSDVYLTPPQVKSTLIKTGDPITDGKVSITKPRVNLGAAVDSLGACTYAITPTQANMAANAGNGTVNVATQEGCSWSAVSNNASWLHVTSGASGTGDGTVGYSVDKNEGQARSGTIAIAGETFTVDQAAGGGGCAYAIDPTSEVFGLRGGQGSVVVSTQAGCSWNAVSHDSWIRILSGASGMGNGTVTYMVLSARGLGRTGTMTIAGQTFTVRQGDSPCTYSISPTQANMTADAGNGTVNVATQEGCSWSAVSNNASWLHVTSGASGTGDGTVGYSVDKNEGQSRSGTIAIAGETFTVDQAAGSGGCAYVIDPTSEVFGLRGGQGTVVVSTQAGCSWTAVSHDSWIRILSGASGMGNGTVTYLVLSARGLGRTGTMTIAGETFTVVQQ